MSKRLFLLDGMALLYRAHFAFIKNPVRTSDGVNTSALYGFANTLLDILKNQQPTHLAVVLDTAAPTPRHEIFPEYKAQREEMPEDIAGAIPQIHRLCAAMRIPLLTRDGYEADDIIGILAKRSEGQGFETFMVTPDKDFGQLVSDSVRIYKPGRQGADVEILGVPEVCAKWGIERPEQVVDILALMGDAVDNIPGIPGFGEKTATALIQKYGSVENLIARAAELKGKQKEKVEQHADKARLSRQLATIMHDAPLEVELEDLAVQGHDDEALKALFTEFEFNALGKRLFGEEFKAGRGRALAAGQASSLTPVAGASSPGASAGHSDYPFPTTEIQQQSANPTRTLADTPHTYHAVRAAEERAALIQKLAELEGFCFDLETTSLDPRQTAVVGIAFSWQAHEGWFVFFPRAAAEAAAVLEEFRAVFTKPGVEKTGHNLKFDLAVLLAKGLEVAGPFFDTMLAHSLIEPEQRHGMDYLAESLLGYTPVPLSALIGLEKNDLFAQATMADVAESEPQKITDYAAEDADVTWQLASKLRPQLPPMGAEQVFYEIESPLLPVLTRMEHAGVKVDVAVLREIGQTLEKRAGDLHQSIQESAGMAFNLNSPKQLGEVLFDKVRLLGQAEEDGHGAVSDERAGAALADRRAPDHPGHPGLPRGDEAEEHLCGHAAERGEPRHGPHPHDVSPAHGGHGAHGVEQSEPAKHPDPQRARAGDTEGLCARRAGLGAAERGLQPGGAARDGGAERGPGDDRGLPKRAGHSPGHRRACLWRAAGRGAAGDAAHGEDGELRHHLRHQRFWFGAKAGHPARGGGADHRELLQAIPRRAKIHAPVRGGRAPPRLCGDHHGPAARGAGH